MTSNCQLPYLPYTVLRFLSLLKPPDSELNVFIKLVLSPASLLESNNWWNFQTLPEDLWGFYWAFPLSGFRYQRLGLIWLKYTLAFLRRLLLLIIALWDTKMLVRNTLETAVHWDTVQGLKRVVADRKWCRGARACIRQWHIEQKNNNIYTDLR